MPRQWEATWSDGLRIVWQSITWEKFKQLSSQAYRPAERYLEIYKTCILEGPTIDKVPFGIVFWLGAREFDQNPFAGRLSQVTAAVNEKRAWFRNSYFAACSAVIASVLHIPFADIEKMDADEFFCRVAQAEFLVGKPLDPVDPKTLKNGKGKRRTKPHEPGSHDMQLEATDYTFTR